MMMANGLATNDSKHFQGSPPADSRPRRRATTPGDDLHVQLARPTVRAGGLRFKSSLKELGDKEFGK